MLKRIVNYQTVTGFEPYADFVRNLADLRGAAMIRTRVERAQLGNLGDHRGVGGGIIEMRIHFGPGYRVYLGFHGEEIIVLLCAGDKSSQDGDIKQAMNYWGDYRRST